MGWLCGCTQIFRRNEIMFITIAGTTCMLIFLVVAMLMEHPTCALPTATHACPRFTFTIEYFTALITHTKSDQPMHA